MQKMLQEEKKKERKFQAISYMKDCNERIIGKVWKEWRENEEISKMVLGYDILEEIDPTIPLPSKDAVCKMAFAGSERTSNE